ncbi:MAG: 1,4-beta-xylanase [Verrucomicrobiales bacterium]|jgi:hypothetical protein|nr:1,4-beta-xylanase [Verrucomicrobiales bacterium]
MKTVNAPQLINQAAAGRWTVTQARDWYAAQPWPVGCNFLPSDAANQLEMWQATTFNPALIKRELGWLAALGLNTVRVFLHDLLWQQDRAGFLARLDQFLTISAGLGLRPMLVFFDSCWHPFPRLGPQCAPEPGVHNSRWVQSPGLRVLRRPADFDRLRPYLTGVISRFRDDARVFAWDLWNEPDNHNWASRGPRDFPTVVAKGEVVFPLLARTFQWARAARPSQPLTSGIWFGQYWDNDETLTQHPPLGQLQARASDLITFHRYDTLPVTRQTVQMLRRFGRPLICTEYMARPAGSTFAAILPYFKKQRVGAYHWGAVAGRAQTEYPWDSWQQPYEREPKLWHHDLLRRDGTPYRRAEANLIKKLTAHSKRNGPRGGAANP